MALAAIGWLFTLGVLAHNAEEARFLPAWSERAGNWPVLVRAQAFRFASVALSALFVLVTLVASVSGAGSVGGYLMAGYVLAMVLNALVPHLVVSVFLRRYMPGTATALLLNLPLGAWYLQRAIANGAVRIQVFGWAGPLVVAALLALLPLLLALGERVRPASI